MRRRDVGQSLEPIVDSGTGYPEVLRHVLCWYVVLNAEVAKLDTELTGVRRIYYPDKTG
jgi:hypothetical protein